MQVSPAASPAAPSLQGTVTLMFTDIEGSTVLLQSLGPRYTEVIVRHHAILRAAIAEAQGREVDTAGDGFFVVFDRARDAVHAAVQAQRALSAELWPDGQQVRVRMGIHTGEPIAAGEGWIGIDVHRTSRIASVAAGGQVLLSAATYSLVRSELPQGVTLRDLGRHSLKDLREAELLYQLEIEGLRSDFPPLDSQAGLHNVPLTTTSLIGRERELADISAILLRDDVRIVTLTGPGGTGKTRLALAVAEKVADAFEDGIWFVPLAPLVDPALVGPSIASVVGIVEQGTRPIIETLAEFFAKRHTLLVLDNFEQITQAATFVAELLRTSPRLEVLVTSRGPLHISSEQEYPVPALNLPDRSQWNNLDEVRHSDAVELFVQRARAARPDFHLTAENAPAIAEICTRIDGLPLAIELAAARIRLFSPQALLARLGRRLDLLRGGARDFPERHHTLRQTIAWSHDLLNADEQALFRRLAVYSGGCTLEAAEHICQFTGSTSSFEFLDGIEALADLSLIRREEDSHGETRLGMLETIRDFGIELLEQAGESDRVRRSHALYFLSLAEHAEQSLTGSDLNTWLDRIEAEHDNLRAAMAWAEQKEETEIGLRLGIALWRFMVIRGHMREGKQQLVRMLQLSDAAKPTPYRAMLLFGLGTLVVEISDYAEARQYLEECLSIARELGDEKLIAQATTSLSWVHTEIGDFEPAGSLAREALELHRQRGDRRGMALALNSLGTIANWTGQLTDAENYFLESLELRRLLGDRRGVGFIQANLSMALLHLGRFDEAAALIDEALATFTLLRDTQLTAWALSARGQLALCNGDLSNARHVLEESGRLWKDVGNKFGIAWSLSHLGIVDNRAGNRAIALLLLVEAKRIFAEAGSRPGLALCTRAIAETHILAGSLHEAVGSLRDALNLTIGLTDRVGTAICLELLAQLSALHRDWIHAATFLVTASALRQAALAPVPGVLKPALDRLLSEVKAATGDQFAFAQEQAKTASIQDVLHVAQRHLRQLASDI